MESLVSASTFVKNLSYFLKLSVYINKGTDRDDILEKCIKYHNYFAKIEVSKTLTQKQEMLVRKILKRVNLMLKVDSDGKPLDISDKSVQLIMLQSPEHESLRTNDCSSMYRHSMDNEIMFIAGIPLSFLLKEGNFQNIMWQYLRTLFYISQAIFSRDSMPELYKSSLDNLEDSLLYIDKLDDEIMLDSEIADDSFLNSKLIKTNVRNDSKDSINDACNEVLETFNKKGMGNNPMLNKMINSISGQLSNVNFTEGNFMESMFSIAQNTAVDISNDYKNDPDGIRNTLNSFVEVFEETMSNTGGQDGFPDEISGMFEMFKGNFQSENKNDSDGLFSELCKQASDSGIDVEMLIGNLENGVGLPQIIDSASTGKYKIE
jgi:hypothetical protein